MGDVGHHGRGVQASTGAETGAEQPSAHSLWLQRKGGGGSGHAGGQPGSARDTEHPDKVPWPPSETPAHPSMMRQELDLCTPTAERFQGGCSLLLSTNTRRWGQKWKNPFLLEPSRLFQRQGKHTASQSHQETSPAPAHQWDLQSLISKGGNLMGTRDEGLVLRQGQGQEGFGVTCPQHELQLLPPRQGSEQ